MFKIDIVSDIVCPWCFIGKRRLEAAIALVRQDIPDFAYTTRWLPFFLNPDTPPEGEPYLPFLEKKFGGKDRVEMLFAQIRQAASPHGLTFAFEKITVRSNTLHAHRLLHWAQQRGNADALAERLFSAQFQRGELVGDRPTLIHIGVECGYPEDELTRFLESDEDTEQVLEMADQVQRAGVYSVPTYIFPGGRALVGAEDPAVIARIIRELVWTAADPHAG